MSAVERFQMLPASAARDLYFSTLRDAVAEHYLAEPDDPYRQSGRTSGAVRWEETRRCILGAVHRSGDFLDAGCANGLLLESLIGWARERGFALAPHGIDFVPELIELARARHPAHRDSFAVANAFYWSPARRYDFVRTNLEYVPRGDRVDFVRRQHAAVSAGGRLIVCHYRNAGEPPADPASVVRAAGLCVGGEAQAPGVEVAWVDAETEEGV